MSVGCSPGHHPRRTRRGTPAVVVDRGGSSRVLPERISREGRLEHRQPFLDQMSYPAALLSPLFLVSRVPLSLSRAKR